MAARVRRVHRVAGNARISSSVNSLLCWSRTASHLSSLFRRAQLVLLVSAFDAQLPTRSVGASERAALPLFAAPPAEASEVAVDFADRLAACQLGNLQRRCPRPQLWFLLSAPLFPWPSRASSRALSLPKSADQVRAEAALGFRCCTRPVGPLSARGASRTFRTSLLPFATAPLSLPGDGHNVLRRLQ